MGRSQFAKHATALIALAREHSPGRVRRSLPGSSRRARAWTAGIAASLLAATALAATASATPALAATPAPLAITTATPLTATAGSAFLAKLDATGGTKPYTWSLAGGTSLPAGLVLHASTGVISGTPVGPAGTFDFIAQVTDSESTPASATAPESITVAVTPLAVTTATLPAATAGVAYSATLTATGGVAPYSWSIPSGSLPAGLTLHAATGAISGTPKAGGTFTFDAEVADSETPAQVADASEAISVGVAGLVVTTASTLPTATSGVPYSVKLSAAGGVTPYVWSMASGSLPAGLKLKSTGTISGTTTATGPDTITVQVTDAENPAVIATQILSLSVVTPMVLPATLPGATGGQPYDASLQPAGGLGPYTYTYAPISPTALVLPPGLTFQAGGEIVGQALEDGTFSFTVSVTDSENPPVTITQTESITVTGPIPCLVTDGGQTFTDLPDAVAAAAPGDTLSIQGTCSGATEIDKNLELGSNTGATLTGPTQTDFGAGELSVLTVDSGATVVVSSLTSLTIDGGNWFSGITNNGTLTMYNSTVTNAYGNLNTPNGDGGGITNYGTLTLNNSNVTNNTAVNGGGGIFNEGRLVLSGTTVSGNTAEGIDGGGGILNEEYGSAYDNSATIKATSSTITDNIDTNGAGGGIYVVDGAVTLISSDVTYNTAGAQDTFSGVGGYGGGIYNDLGIVSTPGSTIFWNSPDQCYGAAC